MLNARRYQPAQLHPHKGSGRLVRSVLDATSRALAKAPKRPVKAGGTSFASHAGSNGVAWAHSQNSIVLVRAIAAVKTYRYMLYYRYSAYACCWWRLC